MSRAEPASVDLDLAPTRRGETIFAWMVFPVVFFGSLGLAIHLLGAGVGPIGAFGAPGLLAYAMVIAGERLYPHQREWSRSRGDVPTDAAWAASVVVAIQLLEPVGRLLAIPAGAWLASRVDSPLWPGQWPLAAQLALALVVVELFQYWVHRLEHETEWLWRFHATHHSAPRLYWLNAARFHVVDIGLNHLAMILPLVALGAGGPVIGLWILASSVHGIFQHANMKIRCGPLNWIFSMTELHRWHHSRLTRESNTNYGQTLILWDWLFRTRFLPRDREPPARIGIAGLAAFPMTWWAQLISPLRWSEIVSASAGREGVAERAGGPQNGPPRR